MGKTNQGKSKNRNTQAEPLSELSRVTDTLKKIADEAIVTATTSARDKAVLEDAGASAAHSLVLLKKWFGSEFSDKPASVKGYDRVISDLVIATFDIAVRTSYTESIALGINARRMSRVRGKKEEKSAELINRRRAAIQEVAKEKHLTLATSEKFARQIEPYVSEKIGLQTSLTTIKSDISALKREARKKG